MRETLKMVVLFSLSWMFTTLFYLVGFFLFFTTVTGQVFRSHATTLAAVIIPLMIIIYIVYVINDKLVKAEKMHFLLSQAIFITSVYAVSTATIISYTNQFGLAL